MKLGHVVILLPVAALEDLSLVQDRDETRSLLSAWTVPFHPAVLTSAGKIPHWECLDYFTVRDAAAESLLLVPTINDPAAEDGPIGEAIQSGALVLRDLSDRKVAIETVLAAVDPRPGDLPFDQLDAELVADCLAVGYCHLVVELLTHRRSYMGSLNSHAFGEAMLRAAEAVMQGRSEDARDGIQEAFDTLAQAREDFFLTETSLLDLTLLAPGIACDTLRADLAGEFPTNVLASGRSLEMLAHEHPATLDALRTAVDRKTAEVVGGEFDESPLSLMTPESILANFVRGLAAHEAHLGRRPVVFGRRRFGLAPIVPQILENLGFTAAIHFTLDGGRFPTTTHSRILWKGDGDATLETLSRVPADAADARPFLRLPEVLDEAVDLDHAPTICFAHWPGQGSPWYDALRRMSRYAPAVGQFRKLTAYFEETSTLGQPQTFDPDGYRSPYLAEAVEKGQADPISRWVRYHARRAACEAIGGLTCMTHLVEPSPSPSPSPSPVTTFDEIRRDIDDRVDRVENDSPDAAARLDQQIDDALGEAARRMARALAGKPDSAPAGRLSLNPCSFGRQTANVEIPGMGFVWVDPKAMAEQPADEPTIAKKLFRRKNRPRPLMAEENVLRNDLFEATLDPTTGAIHAIHDYRTRGNRLAVQLALRMPEARGPDDDETAYTIMAAERIEAENDGRREGRLVVGGRLVDRRGNRVAGFVQTLVARRGCPVLEMDVELQPDQEPGPDPWRSYYAVRFAWDDASAELHRSVNLTSWPTEADRFESPQFVEIRNERRRTTLLTGGLPYHRRFGLRKLDSLLIVRGETARRFRLGIGIDLPHPIAAAVDFLTPRLAAIESPRPPRDSGWLFHVDAPNVLATGWEPLVHEGRLDGFRVRLLETEGLGTRLRLRSFRSPRAARQTDFLGETVQELEIEADWAAVRLKPREWTQIEVDWAASG
ncbi:MAG TPA: hypothetical protein DD670_13190 [Planctomycetaceae bacterium]|nr:hypothetical protein [Planctomycetaceae bacterium]